jgi:hypothetical protein
MSVIVDRSTGKDDDVARRIDLQHRVLRDERLQGALQIRGRDIFQGQDLHVVSRRRSGVAADGDRRGAGMGSFVDRHHAVDAVRLDQRQAAGPQRFLHHRQNILLPQRPARLDGDVRLNFRIDRVVEVEDIAENARQDLMHIGIDEIERDVAALILIAARCRRR